MGSCVSTQDYSSESPRKQQHSCPLGSSSIQEEDNRVLILTSTTGLRPAVTDNLKPQPSPSPSLNDEIFFDSLQYIDSDCEDNNGDFANSGHENGFAGTVGMDEDKNQISTTCEDLTEKKMKKKKLAELFGDEGLIDDDGKKGESVLTSGKKNAFVVNKSERLKLDRSFSSCMPTLTLSSSSSSSERRKKGEVPKPRSRPRPKPKPKPKPAATQSQF